MPSGSKNYVPNLAQILFGKSCILTHVAHQGKVKVVFKTHKDTVLGEFFYICQIFCPVIWNMEYLSDILSCNLEYVIFVKNSVSSFNFKVTLRSLKYPQRPHL